MLLVFILIILILIIAFVVSRIKIINQSEAYVIERLGAYKCTLTTGVHFIVPFVERVAKRVSLKEHVVDFPPQPVITKDNVTMQIDSVVYFQVTDPKLFTYGIQSPMVALEKLTATTLRNLIGDMDLDGTLTSREIINTKMRSILDEATDKWGIKVNRVELKNIQPPREIQDAMEKQMKAERERRESILQAEGKKKSQILIAEGEKESAILKAQAEKESAILRAEAQRESKIRIAEGIRQSTITEAEGKAEAIRKIQKATSEGLTYISEADVNDKTLKIKSLEALEKVADGKSTKLIVPSELQNLTSILSAAKESVTDVKNEKVEVKNEEVL